MTWQPKPSLTVETSHWTSSNMDSVPLHSSSRLGDLGFQMKCKIYFHLKKRTLDQWAKAQLFFSLTQVRNFWRCFCFLEMSGVVTLDALTPASVATEAWHCQISSVPHYCGFKEQEIPTIYTVWMVIYWNVNIIFWDTDCWLSLAVSSNHPNKTFFFKCFTLHVMNLKYLNVSLFEISHKKKLTFSPYSHFF